MVVHCGRGSVTCSATMRGYQRGLASLCCVTVQCGQATHGLLTVWALVYRGCPCRDPPVCPPMPRQDGIRDKAPTLCCACACVASSWPAHSTIWNCGVVIIGADGYEMSADVSAFSFLFFLRGSLHSGRSKVTRVTVGRDTDQPKFSSL